MTRKNSGFAARAQGPGFAVALLGLITITGTAGYVAIEGWGVWDALYMTIITITTVGYREVHTLSRAGEMFTAGLLLAGVGAALYTFTLLATVVVEGGLPKRLRQRRQRRMLEHISGHFILCGYGRIGSIIGHQFRKQQVEYVVIEKDPHRLQAAIDDGALAVEADASNEEVLRRVGITRARGFIAAVGTDAENVYAVLSARLLGPELFIISRAETEDATVKLKRAGANRVISPYQIGAVQMAQTALRPAVVDFMDLATNTDNLDLALEEIPIAETSSLANRSILEADLRRRHGVIVVGIQRQAGAMEFNPEPESSIHPRDKLVVLGRPDALKDLEAEAAG